ncbi:MAG: transposase [Methylococcales bacterium]|nr:transposase [Methylococcales bacterium]
MITNVPAVEASEIALWYYWRWKIERFFKRLKSAGQNLESWQQETGLAIAKRLLVVSMACVLF